MFRYSITLFIRNMQKNLGINLLNVLGLAAGLSACLMIIIYIAHEYSYDSSHRHGDRIVRVNTDLKVGDGQEMHLPTASYPVAEGLAREISSVDTYVRFRFGGGQQPVYVDDRVFLEEHIVWADSTLFEVFSYNLTRGDPKTALSKGGSVVLAESTADRYFGHENPIGREIRMGNNTPYTVTGVMEDIPQPSHFPSHPMICSLQSLEIGGPNYWVGRSNYASYLLLGSGHEAGEVQPLVDEVFARNAGELMKMLNAESSVTLQPLSQIHFDESFDFDFDFQPAVTRRKIAIFTMLAGFILLIACVNFINLATARSHERARQVGISKAIGASRRTLVFQHLGEFVLTSLISLGVALIIVELLLPLFSGFVGRSLLTDYGGNPMLLALFFALAVAVGLVAGVYPALFLSNFRPVDTIRGNVFGESGRSRLRRALIVFQFVISIMLVLCTVTVVDQLRFMEGLNPGYDREQLLVLSVVPTMSAQDCELVRTEALKHPGILAGTCSTYLPTMGHMEYTFEVPQPASCEMLMSRMFTVDEHFLETMGIELVAGRNFEGQTNHPFGHQVIINETAQRLLGWQDPIGRNLDADPANDEGSYRPVPIIGVVKDINFESLHHEVQPMVLTQTINRPGRIALRLHPASVRESIEHVRGIWESNFPKAPFRYEFLDENFGRMYAAEIRLGRLFGFFTGLAIVISCAGLLALIAFSTERRTREIGIRKVLGASIGNLFYLLSREYLGLVLISNIVAWPAAGLIMYRWMENFAYRAPFVWWMYPLAGLATLSLAVLTTATYTMRACGVNPAHTLRQE